MRDSNTTLPLTHPLSIPSNSTALQGVAQVVNVSNAPNSLTIRLPTTISVGRSYALWVVNSTGEWSNGVRINDARPLWISPEVAYRTASYGGLPRQLKVIGRNLRRAPGSLTRVRLSGPTTYTLTASDDGDAATAIERYVARVNLPPSMLSGTYSVQVSRDGTSWVTLQGQQFTVMNNPPVAQTFAITDYGCFADDNEDDTGCLVEAINDAAAVGGTVLLGAGTWDLQDSTAPGVHSYDGIVLPVGVNLQGAGASSTRLLKAAGWTIPVGISVTGQNKLSGIYFEDGSPTDRVADGRYPGYLQLGAGFSGPTSLQDIAITDNVFRADVFSIVSQLRPMRHLFITDNVLGGRAGGLFLGGWTYAIAESHLDDSVISNNTFKPGGGSWPIASQLGMARRVDFSGNIADGRDTEFLSPSDQPGWRAAFFFHMSSNHEMVLISQNDTSCTGDKAGDGEAIVYDSNQNFFGFNQAPAVLAATATTITVPGPLRNTTAGFFNEHWIQIAAGTGLGQVRKVVSHTEPNAARVVFTVAPAWDVTPQPANSMAMVAREFWQTYIVDNTVDIRGCAKATKPDGLKKSGIIATMAMTADSVIEGNAQYESDGIMVYSLYGGVDEPPNPLAHIYQYFNEVRGNTILDEYDYSFDCSSSGVAVIYGALVNAAAPQATTCPATLEYGISVAHNTISHADGAGAISIAHGWWAPDGSKLAQSLLVHHNDISDLPVVARTGTCNNPAGTGIEVELPLSWNTVLYDNQMSGVPTPLVDQGSGTCSLTSSVPQCPVP